MKMRWKSVLDVTATLLMLCASAAILWAVAIRPQVEPGSRAASPPAQQPIPTEPLSLEGAPRLGDPNAPVVIIEFSDFECPFCRDAALNTLPAATEEFVTAGTVQIAFRHFPLERHANALDAAKAAECASRNGQFWPMHDRMFRTRQIDAKSLLDHATTLNVNADSFIECFNSPGTLAKIRNEVAEARALGITGTPTFFVGTLVERTRVRVNKRFSGSSATTIAKAVEGAVNEIRSK